MYQKISRLNKVLLNMHQWLVRCGAFAQGAYLEVIDADKIKIGRLPNDSSSEAIAAAALLDGVGEGGVLSFSIRCGNGFLVPNREVIVEVVSVPADYQLVDPFSLGKGLGEGTTYSIRLLEQWKKVTIKPIKGTEKMVLRIKVVYDGVVTMPRYADFIEFSDVEVKQDAKSNNFVEHITPGSLSEVIFPSARYICNNSGPCTRLVISLSDAAKGKYSTYPTFDGINASRLILSDGSCSWYKNGIDGLGGTIDDVATSLKRISKNLKSPFTVLYGMSMGAYGAILFGEALRAERIIAINPEIKLLQENSRSFERIENKSHKYADLLPILKSYTGDLHLFFSLIDSVDKKSFSHLADKNILGSLYRVEANHKMADHMLNYLWLIELIETGQCESPGIVKVDL